MTGKALFTFIFVLIAKISFLQEIIAPAEAGAFVGKEVTVCGKIYGGKFLEKAKNSPTLLNMGAAYPNQPLTIVIWGEIRKLFSFKPEDHYLNKEVCISGTISTYKEKPQLIITAVSRIKEKE